MIKWKKIKGSRYFISSNGQVKNDKTRKILKPIKMPQGYHKFNFYKTGKKTRQIFIHRLVAHYFIGPCPEGKEVNHIDGNKGNNCVWNLEYVTRTENMKHAYKIGLVKKKYGMNNSNAKLMNEQVKLLRLMYKMKLWTNIELAELFNVCKDYVINVGKLRVRTNI